MKRCPQCNRVETDDALAYCRVDGALLIDKTSLTDDSSVTRLLPGSRTSETDGVQKEQPQITTSSLDAAAKSAAQIKLQESRPASKIGFLGGGIKQNKTLIVLLIVAAILAGGGLELYVARKSSVLSNQAVSGSNITLQRLTTSGKASDAAISPDGKWVAHVKNDAGQQSLWLRQVATTSDTQIVPPSPQTYSGITFSKDGNYVYYLQGELNNPVSRTLFQVPALGGAPRKVIETVHSPVSLSPDGTRLAFMRGNTASGETALVVANADGTGERQVAVRKSPNNFSRGRAVVVA